MGNCIDLLLPPPIQTIRVITFNGGEEEFMATTPVQKIISGPYQGYSLVHHAQPFLPLPLDAKLVSGEVYYLVPQLTLPCSPPISPKMGGGYGYKGQSTIKIVVSKKQLEELLSRNNDVMDWESAGGKKLAVLESSRARSGCRKWEPSLATVPELQAY